MIHYHGTPITPKSQLEAMRGRNFCVSFADPRDLARCLQIGQSVMFDNGAFSVFTRARNKGEQAELDVQAYYEWLDPVLDHPHWAVMPDKIGGTQEEQAVMRASWPRNLFCGYELCAPVFHLHFPLEALHALCLGFPRVCLGSSGEFWIVGSESWRHRMDRIFNYLAQKFVRLPYLHGLRMMGQANEWPMASADSTNVAQNHHLYRSAEELAHKLDGNNIRYRWKQRPEQSALF